MEQNEQIERFCKAVRIKTDWPVGALKGDTEAEASLKHFQDFLAEAYPLFHRTAERFVLSPYSVVYRWPGSNSSHGSSGEKPALILAHYDVVPVEKEKWTADPFGAEIKDGFVYGRGTLDMKNILVGIMEGAEALCGQGFRPQRDIWFAFGGDEERAGVFGAMETAKWFAGKNISFSWILDEGSPLAVDFFKGVTRPLALFGIEEKGFLSLDLTVTQKPGHASNPPQVQAAAVLARALLRISRTSFPYRLIPTVEGFFSQLAKLTGGVQSFALAHARLLGPLFFKLTAGNPMTSSMLHTTIAMTQLAGSSADNVMPSEVRAVLNLRLLQPWTVEKAIGFIKKAVKDERVDVKVHGHSSGPVPANPDHAKLRGPGWQEMEAAVHSVFPDAAILPFIMTATTDSRHYQHLAKGIFRFNPLKLNPVELSLIHGHDERISLENFAGGIKFYTALFGSL
ncbi:peptidase M20 [Spirochaetia bacterium]|nr:peptidase M20 [Spirochaetia bacterium]